MKRVLTVCLILFMLLGVSSPATAISEQTLDEITDLWQTSAHGLNDINCTSCHQNRETKAFITQPNQESCQSCHQGAVETFLLGKHGIRLLEGQSPLTPAMARLPMKPQAHARTMTCNSCHDVHSVNTIQASVDACLTCHNDTHSQNYEKSKHAQLFAADRDLPRPGPTAVTCATCHLPRTGADSGEGTALVRVNHNNTYTLLPQDRMVGEVCLHCHGVEYAYNSIFDPALVEANFDRPPTLSLETFDLVRVLETRRSGNPSESETD
jgi:hypothetical protein